MDLLQTYNGGEIFEHLKDMLEMKSTFVEENTNFVSQLWFLAESRPKCTAVAFTGGGGGYLQAELQSKNRVYDPYFACVHERE